MRSIAKWLTIFIALTIVMSTSAIPTFGQEPAPEPESAEALTADHTLFIPFIQLRTRTPNNQPPPPNFANEWPMAGANPQRTSWTPTEVTAASTVLWYRPIEAYISQNVQLIAANRMIYVSTARGLYALDEANGNVHWRFDTQLPLGNSPTVVGDVLYVGGHDRKLYALNALTGAFLWEYAGAKAGYDSNPLVADGRVFIGSRDGAMYAIGAHGSAQQGQLVWKYQTGGPIHLSAAYSNGVVYFAANDNYAYALRANNGSLVWKSQKMPGDGFHSYWPVIYRDKVIFSASLSYRQGLEPGASSLRKEDGTRYTTHNAFQSADIFENAPDGTYIGAERPPESWSHGRETMDISRVAEYLENNPNPDPHKHKPWRRTFIMLNQSDGREYTFDSDGDGYGEYLPAAYWGTKSGNRFPPLVGPDNILYFNNLYQRMGDNRGIVMGWYPGSRTWSIVGGNGAIAEPQALSFGGNVIYRNLCCDRVGSYFDINAGVRPGNLWSYSLAGLAPGYDPMWTILPGLPRLQGWYKGNTSSINGIYHNHGDQNALIPYGNKVYVHRSNTILAFGHPNLPRSGKLPLLTIQSGRGDTVPVGTDELRQRLEAEVTKMIQAGHLRPGYYNIGGFANYSELADYFDNPGDTLYTLAMAYPYLSPSLQSQTRTYLQQEWSTYFDQKMYASIGWADGAAREAMPIPPEVQANFNDFQKSERRNTTPRFSWSYPPHNFYAMWKYTQIVPEHTARAYDLAKSKLQVPMPSVANNAWLIDRPYELNAYIAGYFGFLRLQEAAGRTGTDAALRTQVTNELNRLYQLRISIFSKDHPFTNTVYHKRSLNIARNFMFMVPELADYVRSTDLNRWRTAIQEYEYVAPYWFVSRYEAMINEGAMSPLYNAPSMFQAKAYILRESRADLVKYLDAPAFERGDLFYIQNLVAALQAP